MEGLSTLDTLLLIITLILLAATTYVVQVLIPKVSRK